MSTEEITCERCGAKLDPRAIVWLEMQNSTAKFLAAGKVAPEGDSQGMFAFGPDCAKRPNSKKRRA